MTDDDFHRKLRELIKEIINLPDEQAKGVLSSAAKEAQTMKDLASTLDKVNKALLDLKICIKYLLFDLEATRRERDVLRKLLDDDSPNKAEGGM